jgi:hypothetical protein
MLGEIVDQETRDRHLALLVALGCAPDLSPALHHSHGLGDDGPAPQEIQPAHPQRGQLTKADTGVGKEQDDQSVGPVLALVEAAVLTDSAGFASASANACTCSWVRISALGGDDPRQG